MTYTLPRQDEVVTRYVLERNAAESPEMIVASFEDGSEWSNAVALEETYRAGNALVAAGAVRGESVGVMLGNGPDFLRVLWGTHAIGATLAPLNTALVGHYLSHLLRLTRPRVIVTSTEWRGRIEDALNTLELPETRVILAGELLSAPVTPPVLDAPIQVWDTAALVATSGTTGPSKVATNSYVHFANGGLFLMGGAIAGKDSYLADLPLFHAAALWQTAGCIITRARLVIRSKPNLRDYWATIRDTGATHSILLSTMVPFLLGQPPRDSDCDHTLRQVLTAPVPSDADAFMRRFGLDHVVTGFGMTELGNALKRRPSDPVTAGYMGVPSPGFEIRLVDEHDIEVPDGTPGEMIFRTEQPWMVSVQYVGDPEGSINAWRNGWFHTGDMAQRKEDGAYYYVDRVKDSLRRRGENVSAFEVEEDITQHPDVEEVAVVSYRDDTTSTDDEIKAWIVPVAGREIDFDEIVEYCARNMPYFMVPRYFELIDTLPKTLSQRVRKVELRALGNSDRTWDREAFGITVTRNGVVRAPASLAVSATDVHC